MFRQPIDAGAFEGDTFKGDDNDLAKVTHQWTNGNWHQIQGEQPQIAAPANMTDIADEHAAQMPGMDAIPGDMPDAERGISDIPLEYNLQTFNALVAANTALQTALSDSEIRVSDLTAHLDTRRSENDHLREVIADSLQPSLDKLQKITVDQERENNRILKLNEGLNSELTFMTDQRNTLQRRLDRSLGYLDRVMDEEEVANAPTSIPRPAPRPPVGPALGQIPDAIPPKSGSRNEEASWRYTTAIPTDTFEGVFGRPRRF